MHRCLLPLKFPALILRRLCHSMSSSAGKRGALVIFEGCDRSGKTTQCKKLVDALNKEGLSAKFWKFPDQETTIGQMCRSYLENKAELEDHVVHLLFCANRWEAKNKMLACLAEGTTLIVDRYSFSGVAFSAAKQDMDIEWCKKPEMGLPDPDAVVYLTLSAEEAAKRGAYGGERYEKMDFQRAVAKNYELLKASNWIEIDADKTIEELHEELKTIVKNIIEKPRTHKVGHLWTNQINSELVNGEPPVKKPCPEINGEQPVSSS